MHSLPPPSPHHSIPWAGQTVGLLGGSFNPAHAGHRHISLQALKLLGLDAVWWMVSPQNPLKSTKDMAPLEERMAGALKASHHPDIIVTDIEQHMNTRYTVDTLTALKKHFPRTKFVWLMGADNLRQLHRWQNWQRLFSLVPVAILDRPPRGSSVKSCPAIERFRPSLKPQEQAHRLKACKLPAWTILHIPMNELSASGIREKRKLQA
jgi:nicotinate-nucleotide adenylyltransferase